MKVRFLIGALVGVLSFALAAVGVFAQQPAGQGRGAGKAPTAPPPINWPSPPLLDGPIVLDTGIQHQIRLVVTKGLNQPWSMAFLPDGSILVTERPGRLRIIRNGVLDPTPVAGLPQIQAQGLGGLMDLALHPRFNENKLVYFTYHQPPATPGQAVITLARGRWDGNALADVRDIFSAVPNGNASRIIFGRDGRRPSCRGACTGSQRSCGKSPAAARRRDRSSGQPIRGPRRVPA